MKYRSRLEIAASFLEITREGEIKTRIMYKNFMSFPQMKGYLKLLSKQGLLSYDAETRRYTTTERGQEFLRKYYELAAMLGMKHRNHKSFANHK